MAATTTGPFMQFDTKRQRLEFDEREVSLVDMRMSARDKFKNADADLFILEGPDKFDGEEAFHVFVRVWTPLEQAEFIEHQDGRHSVRPPKYWFLSRLIDQAKAYKGCVLEDTRVCINRGQLTLCVGKKE